MNKKEIRASRSGRLMTAVGFAACALFGCLLVCNLTIIIKGVMHPEQPPSVLGITPMVVRSGSMSGEREGHIEVGDLIFVGRTDPAELEPGDVVAYMSGGAVVTHRITAIDAAPEGGLRFTTKGDANQAEDAEAVTEEQLVGVYLWRVPKVGDFALFLQRPLGMLVFLGVPLFAFILYDILRRQKYAACQSRRTAELEAELERLRSLSEETGGKEELLL